MFGLARRAVSAVVVGVLILAGCTVEEPGLPLVERPATPERDEAAVLAALRQIDACALLDPAAARAPAFPADRPPRPLGPHRCELTAPGGDRVSVRLGTSLTAHDRLGDFYPRPLGGAKAYVERWANRPQTMCFLHLPVSPALSIRFAAFAGAVPRSGDLCAAAAAFAGVAAERLARPETLRAGADMPMADWDPCAMLATALDDPGYRLTHDADGDHGVDGCVADPGRPSVGGLVRLTLAYGPPADGEAVSEGPGGCTVRWSNGPAGAGTEQINALSAPDCARAGQLAAAVLTAPTTAPSVSPRRPLLYRPDEPDLPVAGACGFYTANPARCRSHVPVPAPDVPAMVFRAAAADDDVACTIARDAVREHGLAALRPVTDDAAGCVFVEPARTVRVTVRLVTGPVILEPQARRTSVAGASAWVSERAEPPMAVRRLDIALRHGTLSVTVHTFAAVGASRADPPDPDRLDIAEAVAREIMTTHLT